MSTKFRAHDPKVGDLVAIKKEGLHDVNKPEILSSAAGVITSRLGPEHDAGILNYKVIVTLHTGEQVRTKSQNLECLHQILESSKAFVQTQKQILEKLQNLSKKKGPEPQI